MNLISSKQETMTNLISKIINDARFYELDKLYQLCVRYRNKSDPSTTSSSFSDFQVSFPSKFENLKSLKYERLTWLSCKVIEHSVVYFNDISERQSLYFACSNALIIEQIKQHLPSNLYFYHSTKNGILEILNFDPEVNNSEKESENEQSIDDDSFNLPSSFAPKLIQVTNNTLDTMLCPPDIITVLQVEKVSVDPLGFQIKIVPPICDPKSPVKSFKVHMFENHGSKDLPFRSWELIEPVFVVDKLDVDVIYYFVVVSENLVGFSDFSSPFYFIPKFAKNQFGKCIIQTINDFEQILPNDNLDYNSLEDGLFKLGLNESKSGLVIADLILGKNVILKSDFGDLFEWGFGVRFEEDHQNEDNLPVFDEGDVQECTFDCPIHLIPNTKIISIAAGFKFSVALDIFGKLYSWGENIAGQLGTGDFSYRTRPTLIFTSRAFKLICASAENSMAVDVEEHVYVWGRKQAIFAQLEIDGDMELSPYNPNADQSSPRKIHDNFGKIIKAECGNCFNVFLNAEGDLFTWGENSQGQLGFDRPDQRDLPFCDLPHKLFSKCILDFSVGFGHTIVRLSKNSGKSVLCGFGLNSHGQIQSSKSIPYFRKSHLLEIQQTSQFWAVGFSTVFLQTDLPPVVLGMHEPIFMYLEKDSLIHYVGETMISVLIK